MTQASTSTSSSTPAGASRLALPIVLAITFLSALGMTIVFPVMPFIVKGYVGDPGQIALWAGILDAVYAACSLVAGPFLGALSDRIGRQPVLVVSLVGGAIGWLVLGAGGALWVLLAGRIIAGLTAGDMSVGFAYMADITAPEDRARRYGLAGAVAGVATLVGPAIGGVLAPINLAAPLFIAAGLSALTALIAFFLMPESLRAERRTSGLVMSNLNPFRTIAAALNRPALRPLLVAFGLMGFALAILATTVPVFALDVLGWGPTQVGLLLSAVGVTDIIVQGGLLGLLLRRLGEGRVVILGLGLIGIASGVLVIVGWLVPIPALLVVATLLFAASEGGTGATLQGLLSQATGEDEQGWLAGSMSAIGSIAQLVGPILAGLLYAQVSRTAPYVLIVLVAVVAMVLVSRPAAELVTDGAAPATA
jgi:MFS transporter, DHA1 family, tetracycline resistance protein